jgi:protein phosphatase
MLSLRAAALTDIGRVRRENEDRFLLDEKTALFGVADGVGGLPGGAEAAQLAVDEIARAVGRVSLAEEPDLVGIVQRANEVVAALGRNLSPAMGIGSTLTMGCIRRGTFTIAHVGDSRCYMARGREFVRVTEDHSVENEARLRRARGEVVFITRPTATPSPAASASPRRPKWTSSRGRSPPGTGFFFAPMV